RETMRVYGNCYYAALKRVATGAALIPTERYRPATLPSFLQPENHDRRAARQRDRAAAVPRRDSDILFALHVVCDDAARDGTAGVEGVERLAAARVEREKIAAQIAGEQHVAGRRRERGIHRRRRLHAPRHLPRLRIDRVDPAGPLADRIVRAPAVGQSR